MALQTLDLTRCRGLTALPQQIGVLTGLQTLKVVGCERLKELPNLKDLLLVISLWGNTCS